MRFLRLALPLAMVCCAAPPPPAAPPRDTVTIAATSSSAPGAAAPAPPPLAAEPSSPLPDATEPAPRSAGSTEPVAVAIPPIPVGQKLVAAKPVAVVVPAKDDPLHGVFSLTEATRGLSGTGPLVAVIETSLGALTCRLLEAQAPRNVANFVGLARGLRPFRDAASGTWVKRPAYDGTTFHRIIRGFMIQGGDPAGTGTGDPGYTVPDEIWANGAHDRAGLLCTANRGPNTNGMQFFVTDDATPHLDGGFTIFGSCAPLAVVHQIAATPTTQSGPTPPVEIRSVRVHRVP